MSKLTGIVKISNIEVNHDTKEFFVEDGRDVSKCCHCSGVAMNELNTWIEDLNNLYFKQYGVEYPHYEQSIIDTLCPTHLYKEMYKGCK